MMIALSVVKKYAETLCIGLNWRFSPTSGFGGIKGEPLTLGTPNLSIELSRRHYMSDPCIKFEEDWTKIVVAIVDERFMRTDTHTDRQTDINCIGHWTDNKMYSNHTAQPQTVQMLF